MVFWITLVLVNLKPGLDLFVPGTDNKTRLPVTGNKVERKLKFLTSVSIKFTKLII